MSQKLLQDQQQLLVKYKAREVRMMMMMMVMIVEDGEVREGEDESEVAAGSATTPSQV